MECKVSHWESISTLIAVRVTLAPFGNFIGTTVTTTSFRKWNTGDRPTLFHQFAAEWKEAHHLELGDSGNRVRQAGDVVFLGEIHDLTVVVPLDSVLG